MTTSHATGAPSKPTGRVRIPASTLGYFRTRNRLNVFSVVQREFRGSGITQAELAARLGRGTDRVCRLLGAPGNWTLDTVSDLLFAIAGAEVNYQASHPLDKPPRNQREPDWIHSQQDSSQPLPGPKTQVVQLNIDAPHKNMGIESSQFQMKGLER